MTPSVARTVGLPYGAVMATGAAAQLVPAVGLPALSLPLTGWAVAQALVIAVRGLVRRVRAARDGVPPRAPGFGMFTVPIGITVIGLNLAPFAGPVAHAGAPVAVTLGWLVTAWLVARLPIKPIAADGTWFLAPAALLADAAGVIALLPRAPATVQPALEAVAVGVCVLGALAYGVVLVLDGIRVARRGLRGAPGGAWWISAGCGGFAAVALGRTAAAASDRAVAVGFGWAALACWAIGSALLVPVLIGSVYHVAVVLRPPYGPVVWPPTFSSGIYSLAAAQVGTLYRIGPAMTVHQVGAVATIAVWAGTSVLALVHLRWARDRAARVSG